MTGSTDESAPIAPGDIRAGDVVRYVCEGTVALAPNGLPYVSPGGRRRAEWRLLHRPDAELHAAIDAAWDEAGVEFSAQRFQDALREHGYIIEPRPR